MAAKSIIEIDVQDEKWKDFQSAFNDYQSALSKMPKEWQGIGVEVARNSQPLDRAAKTQSAMSKAAAATSKVMKGSAEAARTMAVSIKDATVSLLKWSSILGVFSGLIGAGGLFGINRMAISAGATRFTALGLNTTAGGLDSSVINYSRALGNPIGTLGNIRDVQADLSRRWAFNAIGVNPNGDPANMLPQMMKNARDIYTRNGSTLQGAEANGLTNFFSIDDLNRLKNMSNAEIDAMTKRAQADQRQLQISDDVLRKWQDFEVQLDRSGTSIRNAFINGLAPLEPQLERLSEGVSNFITAVLKSPEFGRWMDSAAGGLERLANYVSSPEFEADARQFMTIVGQLGSAIGTAAKWIASTFGGGTPSDPAAGSKGLQLAPTLLGPDRKAYLGSNGLAMEGGTRADRNNNPLNLTASPLAIGSDGRFSKFASPTDGFKAAQRQLMRYASGQTFGGPVDTIEGIVNKWAPAADNNDTAAYVKNVLRSMNNDGSQFSSDQHLNLSDPEVMSKLLAAMSGAEGSKHNYSASQVRVLIENNTGGNAVVSSAQLGGG